MEPVFPLTIKLATGEKHFRSKADLDQWLKALSQAYSWLPEGIDIADQLRNFLVNKTINQIQAHINQAVANEEAGTVFAEQLDAVKQIFTRLTAPGIAAHNYYLPGSERLEYCKRLSESDPKLAAATLHAMLRPDGVSNVPNLLTRGHVTATLYELGLTDHDIDFPKASDKLLADVQSGLDRVTRTNIDADKKLATFKERSTKRRVKQRKEFNDLVDQTRKRWTALEDAYEKKLALNYSVSYWDAKAAHYGRNSWYFGAGAVIFAGIFAYLIGWQSIELFEVIAEAKATRWYQISIVAVYATIGIWIIRLLTRSLMANMHLKVDAEQRVTMITTYLALLKEGRALDPEDRRLIIEALFRPTHSGLISGESAGQSLVEQVAALLTRRGS